MYVFSDADYKIQNMPTNLTCVALTLFVSFFVLGCFAGHSVSDGNIKVPERQNETTYTSPSNIPPAPLPEPSLLSVKEKEKEKEKEEEVVIVAVKEKEKEKTVYEIFFDEVQHAEMHEYLDLIAAQIQVESAWRPNACSIYACGLAQFTLATWNDIAPRTNPSCKGVDYKDPACSVRAQVVYMSMLLRRYRETDDILTMWIFAWVAYNGGMGWLDREIKKCKKDPRCDPEKWWQNVEDIRVSRRAAWAYKENRTYPKKILAALETKRWGKHLQ